MNKSTDAISRRRVISVMGWKERIATLVHMNENDQQTMASTMAVYSLTDLYKEQLWIETLIDWPVNVETG